MADDPQNSPGTVEEEHQDEPGTGTGDEHQDEPKRADQAEPEREPRAAETPAEPAVVDGADLDALRTEIRQEFTAQLVRAEVRAAAAGRLRDPADALALLDVTALAGDGGDVDTAAVAAAVDQLVKDKPYLAAETAGSAPWGDVGAGPRESAEPEPATPLDRLRRAFGTS
ncbi:hypothetical protein [Streptomyces olivoreticuli]|uniref:hypothetical protein n=1 Tax=Streptomyces olivoreticuli TaxID=68246 RepID=UPI000E22D28F|nr:hypothetical protein [Streptomyces olivoreticuli]